MGHEEVLRCLKRNKHKWLNVTEIYEKIKTPNCANITKHLNKMYISREVIVKEHKKGINWAIKYYQYRDDK